MRSLLLLVIIGFALLLPSNIGYAQFRGRFPDSIPPARPDPRLVRMEKENLRRLNKERYAKLKADTEKLLDLATDLKEDVDRADENTLSLDVIRVCEEIEKLAKNVREKMKENIGPAFR